MSSGRYVVEGAAPLWFCIDMAEPDRAIDTHRTRDDADAHTARLEAQHQCTTPRPTAQQTALFNPQEA